MSNTRRLVRVPFAPHRRWVSAAEYASLADQGYVLEDLTPEQPQPSTGQATAAATPSSRRFRPSPPPAPRRRRSSE